MDEEIELRVTRIVEEYAEHVCAWALRSDREAIGGVLFGFLEDLGGNVARHKDLLYARPIAGNDE